MPAGKLSQTDFIGSLYSEHHGWLTSWLRRKLGCPDHAADLAQDAFVRIIAARREAGLDNEPRAFLTHVAKGLVIDHWRRQEVERAYLETLAHLPEPQTVSPETRLLVLQALFRIDAMLRSMPGRTEEVFLLAQLDGLAYKDIAARLGMTLITVKRHMQRAYLACLSVE